jgi:GMP synthase (glutamine-hydrolysing)
VRVLSIVHQADAGPGVFGEVAGERGVDLVEWNPPEGPAPDDALEGYAGVVVLGASANPDEDTAKAWLGEVRNLLAGLLDRGVPTLGVCLGAELLAQAAGGSALRMEAPEIGWVEIELTPDAVDDPLLGSLPGRFPSFQWHGWGFDLPPDGIALAREGQELDAFRVGAAWGLQFHPEVTAEIVAGWLADHESDRDAVAAGFDPAPVAAETPTRIEAANRVGAEIFGNFLDRAGLSLRGS